MNTGMSDVLADLASMCRLHGVRRLRINQDEVELELHPGPPPRIQAQTDEPDTDLSEEAEARLAHRRKWERICRSSGAPIPPFPGDAR